MEFDKQNEETYVTPVFELSIDNTLNDKQRIKCKPLKLNDAITILRDLSNTAIPDNCCLYDIIADVYQNIRYSTYTFKPLSWRNTPNFTHTATPSMSIRATLNIPTKCDRSLCIKNIASGKCRDEFVINNLGKKIFAEKYAKKCKEKTK